ncbi:DUF3618 domain-containing protein [Promicromonospora sp. NPDC052451]|uniref:DUF3618 domain-containing protein n=1 Tax=unclassified Promicromonospora TaxID=2647929 RepID=UPI0037CC2E0B
MSTNDPDVIRADIERTRAELSHDVDTLGDKVHPGHAVRRQADRARSRMGRVKDRVMGTAHDTTHSAQAATHDLADRGREAASSVAHGVSAAPDAVRDRTRGNPLVVGLVAFGAGLAAASLIPAGRAERRAAAAVEEKAAPLVDDLRTTARDAVHDLQEPAREGVDAVRDAAKDAARSVGEHSREAAADLRSGSGGSTT